MTADELARCTMAAAAEELREALGRIRHCLDQLADEQIWWRPAEPMNAIGNLLLHLAGNLRQWIVAGLGGASDVRVRASEFAERTPIARQELLGRLEETVAAACDVLGRTTADELVRARRVQGFDVSGLAIVFHAVPHFRGHAQEIVHLARTILGDAYCFAWQPASAEQGAPPA